MKAHIYKYTVKIINDKQPHNVRYLGYFKTHKIFLSYINHQNALSVSGIWYLSKSDKLFNAKSDSKTVPPLNPVWISKNHNILE